MAPYQVFRINGEPTHYGEIRHSPFFSILWAGLITALLMLMVQFLIILVTLKWSVRKIPRIIGGLPTIGIGFIIIFCLFGEWETATIRTRAPYSAYTDKEVTAFVGVHVNLYGLNITLEGDPPVQFNETIVYNEHLSWMWDQGRPGYGTQAGHFAHSYKHSEFRGAPLPILQIAEYFNIDGEFIRWGRYYRIAGYYAHILLWTAFPLWAIGCYFLVVQVFNWAGICLLLTGICMELAVIIWGALRNACATPLKIPFEDGVIVLSYSWSFGLVLVFGLLAIVLGSAIIVLSRTKMLMSKKNKKEIEMKERTARLHSEHSQLEMKRMDKPHVEKQVSFNANPTQPPQQQQPQQVQQPQHSSQLQPQPQIPARPPTGRQPSTNVPQKGQFVMAKYSRDGQFYQAKIDDVQGNQYLVSFLEYPNSQEWVSGAAIKV